ncbi:hypothetical protein HJB99_12320 [Rhizobium sp. NLR17b]|uniref:hypothetical protein n=1 Tax=Rhizobium sp. NLR17b TaxID=2731114 RepID=UPI001C828714|nr:hypothetical protein [Rhizobium sp. NLR17b]MBX5269460.1 hypothetical protein [Rhizobium sp. NLR17b]
MRWLWALALFLFMIVPAGANWQYTCWGMSPENLLALAPQENALRITSDDRINDYQKIEGLYSAEGFHFQVRMLFIERKLYAVHLSSEDGGFECSDLRRALKDIYGASAEHGSALFGDSLLADTEFDRWQDSVGENIVTLYNSDPCTIVYRSPNEIEQRKIKGL